MELGYINIVKAYEDLEDIKLRAFLDSLVEDKRERKLVSKINKIVYSGLSMSMRTRDARARMKMLYVAYRSLLKKIEIKWRLECS